MESPDVINFDIKEMFKDVIHQPAIKPTVIIPIIEDIDMKKSPKSKSKRKDIDEPKGKVGRPPKIQIQLS